MTQAELKFAVSQKIIGMPARDAFALLDAIAVGIASFTNQNGDINHPVHCLAAVLNSLGRYGLDPTAIKDDRPCD